mgnify:CR=1 FL=1
MNITRPVDNCKNISSKSSKIKEEAKITNNNIYVEPFKSKDKHHLKDHFKKIVETLTDDEEQELEDTSTQYQLSPAKLYLINRIIMEDNTYTVDILKSKSVRELYRIINTLLPEEDNSPGNNSGPGNN